MGNWRNLQEMQEAYSGSAEVTSGNVQKAAREDSEQYRQTPVPKNMRGDEEHKHAWLSKMARQRAERRKKRKAKEALKKPKSAMRLQRERDEFIAGKKFLETAAWKKVRGEARELYGMVCMKCGSDGSKAVIHVDHIKPRKYRPDLALDLNNLQILCENCNRAKGNECWDDYRLNSDALRSAQS